MTAVSISQKREKSLQFWNKQSKSYDQRAKDKTYDMIGSLVPKYLDKDHTIMDFACATGLYTIKFANDVKQIHAFDTSNEMIDMAKENAHKHGLTNASFLCTTLFDETYEENTFDVILAFNILLYFENVEEVLARLSKLLKPDGIMISSTACLKERNTFQSKIATRVISFLVRLGVLPYLNFFNRKELKQMITSSEFETMESKVLFESPATEYFIVSKKMG